MEKAVILPKQFRSVQRMRPQVETTYYVPTISFHGIFGFNSLLVWPPCYIRVIILGMHIGMACGRSLNGSWYHALKAILSRCQSESNPMQSPRYPERNSEVGRRPERQRSRIPKHCERFHGRGTNKQYKHRVPCLLQLTVQSSPSLVSARGRPTLLEYPASFQL